MYVYAPTLLGDPSVAQARTCHAPRAARYLRPNDAEIAKILG